MNLFPIEAGADRARRITRILASVTLCLTSVISSSGQTPPPIQTTPTKSIVPVHLDPATGNIKIGNNTFNGANNTFHIVAIDRIPRSNTGNNPKAPEDPTLLLDKKYTDAASLNSDLAALLTSNPGAMIFVAGIGNYGFNLQPIGVTLANYGATVENEFFAGVTPYAQVGIGGAAAGSAAVQLGGFAKPIDGYLATDNYGNYAFIETDFIRYDMNPKTGDIRIGSTTYPANSACGGGFHLLIVDREDPSQVVATGDACTDSGSVGVASLATNLNIFTTNGTDETRLVFLTTFGSGAPSVNFGTDGDPNFYALGRIISALGGYWETLVYLNKGDTYSFVGTSPSPPSATVRPARARESSSVYPATKLGLKPSGELHGVLGRIGRGHFYTPINGDPSSNPDPSVVSGNANLGIYEVLATPAADFPSVDPTAYAYINTSLCKTPDCNIRDAYGNVNFDFNIPYTELSGLKDQNNKDCTINGSGANDAFCKTRTQLLIEFQAVQAVKVLFGNLDALLSDVGTVTIFSLLGDSSKLQDQINPPMAAPTQSLVNPITNFVLGLASFIPEVGPLFGLADLAFNFGTSLTTDEKGNKTIDISSTVGDMFNQASDSFTKQKGSTGTLFSVIYQDWGKLSKLGTALETSTQAGSPWYWPSDSKGKVLTGMKPAIEQAAYTNILPTVFAIGSYFPQSSFKNGWIWGTYPVAGQPYSYGVEATQANVQTQVASPFWDTTGDVYHPYTFPGDPSNGWVNTPLADTMITDGAWLGISRQTSIVNPGTAAGLYEPPGTDIRTKLFSHVYQNVGPGSNGLGVYLPAFFHSWPFPRVTCYPSYGVTVNGATSSGGCPWSQGAVTPQRLAATPRYPVVKASVHAIQSAKTSPRSTETQVLISIHNTGTAVIESMKIDYLAMRALDFPAGITMTSASLPFVISNLKPGEAKIFGVNLYIPLSTSRISLGPQGTMTSGPRTYTFNEATTLTIK